MKSVTTFFQSRDFVLRAQSSDCGSARSDPADPRLGVARRRGWEFRAVHVLTTARGAT